MDEIPRGVIFDMDGVLADTARAHFETWRSVARRWKVELSWDDFQRCFGRPNHETIPELFGPALAEEEIRQIDRLKETAFREEFGPRLEPVAGVAELVEDLHRERWRLAVGSSGPRENIELVLRAIGLTPYFGAIVSGWEVERGKPHPEVFLTAAAKISVSPARCLVIEDMPAGIRAARAAGMRCVALTTTRPAEDLGEADRVLGDLRGFTAGDAAALLDTD
ncbi:MAG: HAD family hydrolase [Planctomycetota bacterium]|jgi:beta-phosphoglucomutase family hydrolase